MQCYALSQSPCHVSAASNLCMLFYIVLALLLGFVAGRVAHTIASKCVCECANVLQVINMDGHHNAFTLQACMHVWCDA